MNNRTSENIRLCSLYSSEKERRKKEESLSLADEELMRMGNIAGRQDEKMKEEYE